MKIYRDMTVIFWQTIILIIGLGVVLPVSFLVLLSILATMPTFGIESLIIFSVVISILAGCFFAYVLVVQKKNAKNPTIETTASGFRYPYLLQDDIEIPWGNIQKFDYILDRSGKYSKQYIVVELSDDVELGKLKHMPGRIFQKSLQKQYDSPILVLFRNVIKGHNLSDLTDRLNAERNRLVYPPVVIDSKEPVFYQPKSETSLLSLLGFKKAPKAEMAILFDQQGISVINGQMFSSRIDWDDIQHIEVAERKDGQWVSEPVLVIQLRTEHHGQSHYEIANTLQDTTVYEVLNSLRGYVCH